MSSIDHAREREGEVATKERQEVQEPPLYKVLLHNDDYTTMEFVILVLQTIFHKSVVESTEIMLHVHRRGVGIAGVYTKEIAETKVAKVQDLANKEEHPLRCSMEKA